MDHVVVSAQGTGPALPEEPVPMEPGRCVYAPRFDLRGAGNSEGGTGYGIQPQPAISPGRFTSSLGWRESSSRASTRSRLFPVQPCTSAGPRAWAIRRQPLCSTLIINAGT
jgi:hypothetical protein